MRACWLVSLAIAAIFVLAIGDRQSGLPAWLSLRSELAAARGRISALAERTAALQVEIDALEQQDFALERAIREDLELARPGETVVRFTLGADRDGSTLR